MITVTKQENGVLFTFTNSDKYLYGSGTIEVPFNSLSIIQDESDNITLRKSASNDIFLSARYDTDFGYASKEEAVNALKEILYDEAGISEEEVQEMIDAATSGIPSSEVVEQLRRDVNAVSGEVDTKQDILTAGENITISGNVISADNNIIELTQAEYDALETKDPEALYIITDAQEINMNDYYTKSEVDASIATKADASALTAVNNALTAHTADTNVHVTSTEKAAWNAKADASAVTAVSNDLNALSGEVDTKVDATTYESGQYATAQALNALQENKLDASAYTPTDLSEYWTSAQTQSAIDAATSGIPSSQVVEQLRTDVNTLSGKVDTNTSDIADIWDTIDLKEEVIASALTQLNQDVAEIDAKEEVISSALTEVRQDVNKKAGVCYVDFWGMFIDSFEMDDAKWDEMVEAYNNNAIFYAIPNNDYSNVASPLMVEYEAAGTYLWFKLPYGDGYAALTLNIIEGRDGYEYSVSDTTEYLFNVDDQLNSGSTNPVQNAVITQALDNKLDASAYTPTDLSNYYTKGETDGVVNGAVSGKADTATTYTKTEVDNALSSKADASALTSIESAVTAVSNNVDALSGAVIDNEYTVSQAINELKSTKLDASAYTPTDLSEYWTSGQTQSAIDAATSGKVDTSAITTAITSGSTDSEIPTAKAVYDATQSGGGSSTDTYVSGGTVGSNGVITLTKNDGTTASVTGLNTYVGNQIDIAKTATGGYDDSYVNVSGDTMTGALNIQTANITGAAIALKDNSTDILTIGRETGSSAAIITIPNGGITNGTDSAVWGNGVNRVLKITQAQYDALATKDSYTLYIVVD